MKEYARNEISYLILEKIREHKSQLTLNFENRSEQIGFFFIDDILPLELAHACFNAFPDKSQMTRLKSLREYKYVSSQMNKHPSLLEEVLFAFQDKRIVKEIGSICKIESLYADESLYAGGISLMAKDNFLHPHLDNSHDADRNRWRVLNLLYYVTPDWQKPYGGHLEIWPEGPDNEEILIESKFNRLVVMATHEGSWHSVNKVMVDDNRCCISNYYFSEAPLRESDAFHVTKFRGRPQSKMLDLILKTDSELRMLVRKIFKKGVKKNPHIYKKEK